MKIRCMKCRENKEIPDEQVEIIIKATKKGAMKMGKAKCPVCGRDIWTMLGRAK